MELKKSGVTLRIATYNIGSTYYAPGGEGKMNELLRRVGAEVVGLQELDYCNRRHDYDMLQRFLDCGDFGWGRFQKAIDFQGGGYGIGQLAVKAPLEASGGPLPGDGHWEKRAWQRLVTEKQGKRVAVYNTHLCVEDRAQRQAQMRFLAERLEADPEPYRILTGDLNTEVSREELEPLLKSFRTANGEQGCFATYNRPDPRMKRYDIDHIFYSSNIRLLRAGMEESNLSDHNLLFAELELL